ncbi:MAG TPA: dihydroxyacetone kinase subunit DhaK [Candidatus Dorea intestinavium]|nr:dihydroxyacetone kinase subunit DhaK [Candidatus Dorea intestinavium]
MKKIINSPEQLVLEMCSGIALTNPELELISKYKILKKKKINKDKVSIISGGGSGHEPAHAGYIGKGMLDAAVCGDVFASPSQIQIYQAIKAVAGEKGVLLVIKNYSGDIMNFKNAAAMAKEDGIKVDYVKVDDDIAVKDSLYTVGRRGVAGTVFVHKIAGAAAEAGKSLEEVKRIAEEAASKVRSIGFAFSPCTVPAKGSPTFILEEDEMEYGVGIHGEPGIRREKLVSADELAKRMIASLSKELELKEKEGEQVALMVNGFGGTPLMELYILNQAIQRELAKQKTRVYRCFVGNFMTSIEMAGASVSLLKVEEGSKIEELLDAPCHTLGLQVDGPVEKITYVDYLDKSIEKNEIKEKVLSSEASLIKENITIENMQFILQVMTESILKNEVPFCELDAHAGDGDFGMSIAKGFRELKKEWNSIVSQESLTIGKLLSESSLIIMEYCGGASGPIWGSAFRAAGKTVGEKETLAIEDFAEMMQAAVKAIQTTGERSFGRGAVVGDKTLIDALIPCANSWSTLDNSCDFIEAFKMGAKAAIKGAKATEEFSAKMGRAGTVGDRSIGYPDAGAYALGVIFTDITESLTK